MPTEFESGAREELRWAETTQHALTATAMTVMPHGGNPTGPYKSFSRGPTDEVRSDLQVQDNVARGFTVPFSFGNVVRYSVHDLIAEQAFNARWLAAFNSTVLTNVSSAATGNKLVAAAGTPFAALTTHVPCPVWVCRGGATPITGRPVLATAVLASGAELELGTAANDGITLTNVVAGDSVQVMHSGVLKPGTEHIYALVERAQTGLVHFYGGMGLMCTKMDFKGQKGSDPTWAFDFMGKGCASATATFGTSVVPAPTFLGFNMGSDFQFFREGGSTVATLFPRSLDWSWSSGASPIDPAGQDGPYAHQKNRMVLSGNVEYFSNDAAKAIGDKARTPTDSRLFASLVKTEGGVTRAYTFWIPLIQYVQSQQQGGGVDGALTTPTQWNAARSGTYGCTMAFARFTGVPLTL